MTRLQSKAPKAVGSRDRCVSLEATAAHIPLLRRRFGITRVGDTTYLDRTGLPTYCAMVPNSPDILGVYNGKGRTALAARVSAVMEAFERQAAATFRAKEIHIVDPDIVNRTLDLKTLDPLAEIFENPINCVVGVDLNTGASVPIPEALVPFPWRGRKLFKHSTTNGLASGNNLVEAVYHAVVEMIERHVWSLFFVRSELVPQFFRGTHAKQRVVAPQLVFPTGDIFLDATYLDIVNAGLDVRVTILCERTLPLVAVACVSEPGSEPPMAHIGMGCSLSPAHAVERALTEAVQSRVVDVQAAREDILRADAAAEGISTHAMRLKTMPKDYWFVDLPAPKTQLSDFADEASDDVAVDVCLVLKKMAESGIDRVFGVDISPENQPFAAVRIIAPAIETTAIDGRVGPIALNEFNPLSRASRN